MSAIDTFVKGVEFYATIQDAANLGLANEVKDFLVKRSLPGTFERNFKTAQATSDTDMCRKGAGFCASIQSRSDRSVAEKVMEFLYSRFGKVEVDSEMKVAKEAVERENEVERERQERAMMGEG